MKKRIFSLLLAALLCLSYVPGASASEEVQEPQPAEEEIVVEEAAPAEEELPQSTADAAASPLEEGALEDPADPETVEASAADERNGSAADPDLVEASLLEGSAEGAGGGSEPAADPVEEPEEAPATDGVITFNKYTFNVSGVGNPTDGDFGIYAEDLTVSSNIIGRKVSIQPGVSVTWYSIEKNGSQKKMSIPFKFDDKAYFCDITVWVQLEGNYVRDRKADYETIAVIDWTMILDGVPMTNMGVTYDDEHLYAWAKFTARSQVFNKTEPTGPVPITSVDFASLTTELTTGSPERPTAVLASGSHCSVTYRGPWLERVSGGYYTGTAGQGKTYYYNLEFTPDEGFTFGDVGTKVPVYLNGTKLGDAEVEKRGSSVKLYFTVSYTVPVTGLPINDEIFPSYWFQEYIKEFIDTEEDGYLTDAERNAVTEIDIDGCENQSYYWQLSSLAGIGYFPNLQYLYCGSPLETLDLSGNKKLIEVRLNNDDAGGRLTKLNVTGLTKLESLSLYDNKVSSLDLTTNTALRALDVDGNQLKSLDLSKNAQLESLYAGYNTGLTKLELSHNTALRTLSISGSGISGIDLSSLAALENLYCEKCGMTKLDLTKNAALKSLRCGYNSLTGLDLSGCPAMEYLDCRENRLTALDVKPCPVLKRLDCRGNKLSALNVTSCPALSELTCYGNDIKALDISACTALKNAYHSDYHSDRTETLGGKEISYTFHSGGGGVLAVEKGVKITENTPIGPKRGDYDKNKVVDARDHAYLSRALVGKSGCTMPGSSDMAWADLNGDGAVNRLDRIYLARALKGVSGLRCNRNKTKDRPGAALPSGEPAPGRDHVLCVREGPSHPGCGPEGCCRPPRRGDG